MHSFSTPPLARKKTANKNHRLPPHLHRLQPTSNPSARLAENSSYAAKETRANDNVRPPISPPTGHLHQQMMQSCSHAVASIPSLVTPHHLLKCTITIILSNFKCSRVTEHLSSSLQIFNMACQTETLSCMSLQSFLNGYLDHRVGVQRRLDNDILSPDSLSFANIPSFLANSWILTRAPWSTSRPVTPRPSSGLP